MQIIPAIDVLAGSVVRLHQGQYDQVTTYAHDAVSLAKEYSDSAGLIHVVDLGAARDGGMHDRYSLCRAMAGAGVEFQIGGGIRSVSAAKDALSGGANRVVVGSLLVHDPEGFEELADEVGVQRLVGAVDVADGKARGSGWEDEGTDYRVVLDRVQSAGVEWVLVTGISRDGTMQGPDLELLSEVRQGWPDLSVIASGGVGRLSDLEALKDGGLDAVVIGRALLEGVFTLEEALRV